LIFEALEAAHTQSKDVEKKIRSTLMQQPGTLNEPGTLASLQRLFAECSDTMASAADCRERFHEIFTSSLTAAVPEPVAVPVAVPLRAPAPKKTAADAKGKAKPTPKLPPVHLRNERAAEATRPKAQSAADKKALCRNRQGPQKAIYLILPFPITFTCM